MVNRIVPGPKFDGMNTVSAVAAGSDHSLVLIGGVIWAWGRNDHGQLGDGTTVDSAVPVPVKTSHTFATIAAGGDHSLAVDTDGTVWA